MQKQWIETCKSFSVFLVVSCVRSLDSAVIVSDWKLLTIRAHRVCCVCMFPRGSVRTILTQTNELQSNNESEWPSPLRNFHDSSRIFASFVKGNPTGWTIITILNRAVCNLPFGWVYQSECEWMVQRKKSPGLVRNNNNKNCANASVKMFAITVGFFTSTFLHVHTYDLFDSNEKNFKQRIVVTGKVCHEENYRLKSLLYMKCHGVVNRMSNLFSSFRFSFE